MAGTIKRGESLFIPFQNGESIRDSQLRPRVYKSVAAYEKKFPKSDAGFAPVVLAEYAEVIYADWIFQNTFYDDDGNLTRVCRCSHCDGTISRYVCGDLDSYCHSCGAKMGRRMIHENLG